MRRRYGPAARLGVLAPALWAAVVGSSHAAFPGRDGRIVFTTERGRIGTMQADGSRVRYLSMRGASPAWSPDGLRIVFVPACRPVRGACGDRLAVMSVDGGAVRRIRLAPVLDFPLGPFSPSWSPRGRRLVFVRRARDGLSAIVTADADGSHERTLAHREEGIAAPVFSPDGRRIVFSTGSRIESVAVGTTSGGAHVLYEGAFAESAFAPSWSPDGGRIAFLDVARGPTRVLRLNIMNRDGGDLQRVRLERGPPSGSHHVVWSPDGSTIASLTAPGRLEIGPVDGSSRRLVGPPMNWFDWQPRSD